MAERSINLIVLYLYAVFVHREKLQILRELRCRVCRLVRTKRIWHYSNVHIYTDEYDVGWICTYVKR